MDDHPVLASDCFVHVESPSSQKKEAVEARIKTRIRAKNRIEERNVAMGKLEKIVLPDLGSHELGTEKLPVEQYISPEFFELEKKHVFGKSWLMVGRASDVQKPGDYITFQVEALSASVVIVRGKDDELRAFHNACTHRGARIVNAPCGKARGGLVCPFHGWAFGFDGSLIDVPGRELFGELDLGKESLHAVSVDVWGGFVFINLDPKPAWTLREYLAPLDDAFDRYLGNPQWSWSYGWRATFNANWKLLVDAQLEGYHVDQTHRKTIAGTIPAASAPAFPLPDSIGVPSKVSVFRPEDPNVGIQTAMNLLSAKYGATSIYTKPEKAFAAEGGEGVLQEDHPLWIFDNYLLFPNIVMFVQKGQIFIQRTIPLSADECTWEVDFYHTEKTTDFGQAFNSEQGRIQIRDVLSEDLYTAEGIQANYRSGAITHVNINKQEVAIRAFYHRLMRAVDQGSEKEAQA